MRKQVFVLYPILLLCVLYLFISIPLSPPSSSAITEDQKCISSLITNETRAITRSLSPSSLFYYVNAIEIPVSDCNDTFCETYDPNQPHIPCSKVYVFSCFMLANGQELISKKISFLPTLIIRPSEFCTCVLIPGSCVTLGGTTYQPVSRTGILNCTVNAGIDCIGNTTFLVHDYPCKFTSGVQFPTVVIASMIVGVFGVDRFCLGYLCCGLGKLFTLGGIGVWWFIDLVLLLVGRLQPADGSSWESVY